MKVITSKIFHPKLKDIVTLRFITIDGYKNFFISRNGVLIHNGFASAAIAYNITKTFCYGTVVASVASVALPQGGPVASVVNTVLSTANSKGSQSVTVVANLITNSGYGQEAALTTVGVVSSAGGLIETEVAIETLACGVGYLVGLIPFLP